jgi:hypothetical protein
MTALSKDSRWPFGHRVAVAQRPTVQGEKGKQWKGKQWKPN